MLNKDEFMPVLGIAVMVSVLFLVLQKYGDDLKKQREVAKNE